MAREGAEPILPTQDVSRTRAFYESLGFKAGYYDERYEILRRGNLVVHLEARRIVRAQPRAQTEWAPAV